MESLRETFASGSPVPLLLGLWPGPRSWEEKEQRSHVQDMHGEWGGSWRALGTWRGPAPGIGPY